MKALSIILLLTFSQYLSAADEKAPLMDLLLSYSNKTKYDRHRSEELIALLKAGADPNTYCQDSSFLFNSIITKDHELAKCLLESKADPNALALLESRPLIYVKDVKLAELLLEHGAQVNFATNTGYSLLHQVLMENTEQTPELLELYCKAGANTRAKNKRGLNPLQQMASGIGFYKIDQLVMKKIVKILVENGAYTKDPVEDPITLFYGMNIEEIAEFSRSRSPEALNNFLEALSEQLNKL